MPTADRLSRESQYDVVRRAELAASREQCANPRRDEAASESPTRIAETGRAHSVEIQNDNFPG